MVMLTFTTKSKLGYSFGHISDLRQITNKDTFGCVVFERHIKVTSNGVMTSCNDAVGVYGYHSRVQHRSSIGCGIRSFIKKIMLLFYNDVRCRARSIDAISVQCERPIIS